jgi:predicted dehydrogenase
VHTLVLLEPGHFHAALTLRERQPLAREEIFVYSSAGPELDDFLGLIGAFNRRSERPTRWRPVVRAGNRPLERLVAERPGDVAILAGRNDRKMAMMRRLHDAGMHVLADKPWLVGPDGLEDLRHVLSVGPLAAEIMTSRHEITSILTGKLVAEDEVFGDFVATPAEPAIEMASVHHLEKTVNGRPLRRPPWFFDVRVQGDGTADIPTHMVDQAQRLVRAAAPPGADDRSTPLELVTARTWATAVPRALFARVTGRPEFPPELDDLVSGSQLAYRGNAALAFRAGEVTVALDTRWELSAPTGGGDSHRSVIRGGRAELRIEQGAVTGWERRLSIVPRHEPDRVRATLVRIVSGWQAAHPGLALAETAAGWDLRVPRTLDVGHEHHFPLVLADFLALVDGASPPPSLAADTLAKYTLLARASAEARRLDHVAPP